MSFAYLI